VGPGCLGLGCMGLGCVGPGLCGSWVGVRVCASPVPLPYLHAVGCAAGCDTRQTGRRSRVVHVQVGRRIGWTLGLLSRHPGGVGPAVRSVRPCSRKRCVRLFDGPECALNVPWMFPKYSLNLKYVSESNIPGVFPKSKGCVKYAPSMFLQCSVQRDEQRLCNE